MDVTRYFSEVRLFFSLKKLQIFDVFVKIWYNEIVAFRKRCARKDVENGK